MTGNKTNKITDIVARNQIQAESEYDLQLLTRKAPHLIACNITPGADALTFQYTPKKQTALIEFLNTDIAEKYQIIEGIADLQPLLGPYTFAMSPENIYTDIRWNIAVLKRDVNKKAGMDEAEFMRMYKALAACLLLGEDIYEKCLYGGDDVLMENKKTTPLCEIETAEEMRDYFTERYKSLRAERQSKFSLIKKTELKRLKITRTAAVFLLIIIVCSGIYYGYNNVRYYRAAITGYESFLSKDYLGCISGMQPISTDRMTNVQTQILATAYVSAEPLSSEQRTSIINAISLTTPDRNKYWIHIGRGQFDEAVDIALRLPDEELQLYAYMKQRDRAETDTSISGTEKEEKLESIQQKIDALVKKLGLEQEQDRSEQNSIATENSITAENSITTENEDVLVDG